MWIIEKLNDDLEIIDFAGSWANGIFLGAFVDSFLPGSCSDWKTWSPITAEKNAAHAMYQAAEWLDVVQIMTPRDMVNHFTEEESRMAYLSQFLFARVKPGFEHIGQYELPVNRRRPRSEYLTTTLATDVAPPLPKVNPPIEEYDYIYDIDLDNGKDSEEKTQKAQKLPITTDPIAMLPDIYDWSSDIWSQVDSRFKEELNNVVIRKDSIEMKEIIGQGEYGEVFRARMKDKQMVYQMVAVKKLKGAQNAKKTAVLNFLKEAAMLQSVKHENIVPLIGFLIIESQPHIIQPLMESNLLDHIKKNKNKLDENDLYGYLYDAAKGLAHIANIKIVHRDIAARNCLISENLVVKIGDFGMARDIFEQDCYYTSTPNTTPMAFRWMASEAVNRNKFTLASDVFSFGVLMYEVFTKGERPYGELPVLTLVALIHGGNRPPLKIPTGYPVEIQELFSQCLSEVPDNRPTMKEVSGKLEKYAAYSKVKDERPQGVARPLPRIPQK